MCAAGVAWRGVQGKHSTLRRREILIEEAGRTSLVQALIRREILIEEAGRTSLDQASTARADRVQAVLAEEVGRIGPELVRVLSADTSASTAEEVGSSRPRTCASP